MTSNELNEILNKTRRTKEISLKPEQVEEIIKKLETLEILKSVVMITRNKSNGAYDGCYCLKLKPNVIPSEDTSNKIKRWLDE